VEIRRESPGAVVGLDLIGSRSDVLDQWGYRGVLRREIEIKDEDSRRVWRALDSSDDGSHVLRGDFIVANEDSPPGVEINLRGKGLGHFSHDPLHGLLRYLFVIDLSVGCEVVIGFQVLHGPIGALVAQIPDGFFVRRLEEITSSFDLKSGISFEDWWRERTFNQLLISLSAC
jgi:hypothetical protein